MIPMFVVYLVAAVVFVGVVYVVNQVLELPRPVKVTLNIVFAIVALLFLLGVLGFLPAWRLR